MKPLSVCMLVALLTAGACHKTVDPNSGTDPYPDNRGELVGDLGTSAAPFYGLLDWSADGNELYFLRQSGGRYQLHAVNVSTHASRLLAQDARWYNLPPTLAFSKPLEYPLQSPDGQFIYLLAQPASPATAPYYLYQIDTRTQNRVVVVDSTANRRDQNDHSIYPSMLSADGTRLSLQYRYDSVRIRNLANRTAVNLRANQVVVFSPDAGQVMIRDDSGATQIVSLTDFSAKPANRISLPDPTNPGHPEGSIQWHQEGIRYIYRKDDFLLSLWNVTRQTSTLLRPTPPGEVPAGNVAWSRDGRRIAFTAEDSKRLLTKTPYRSLYSLDLTTMKTTLAAGVSFREDEREDLTKGGPVLAPDNARLAYSVGSKVYVAAIQP